jgi:hypothetical protein
LDMTTPKLVARAEAVADGGQIVAIVLVSVVDWAIAEAAKPRRRNNIHILSRVTRCAGDVL